jgi:hypothetical protein
MLSLIQCHPWIFFPMFQFTLLLIPLVVPHRPVDWAIALPRALVRFLVAVLLDLVVFFVKTILTNVLLILAGTVQLVLTVLEISLAYARLDILAPTAARRLITVQTIRPSALRAPVTVIPAPLVQSVGVHQVTQVQIVKSTSTNVLPILVILEPASMVSTVIHVCVLIQSLNIHHPCALPGDRCCLALVWRLRINPFSFLISMSEPGLISQLESI